MKKIKRLGPHETIICAYAQKARGSGWANQPLWYIVQDGDKKLHEECLQPDEQSKEIGLLYDISETVHNALLYALECHITRRKK